MEQKRILRVVVASPGDVQPERDLLDEVVAEVNRSAASERGLLLELRKWETDAYPGFHPEGPQGLIDPILEVEECDILIGIFWKRFGTPTAEAQSGTEHEIMRAYAAWEKNRRPQVMVYFNKKKASPDSKEETDQWGLVLEFKKRFPAKGLWWHYNGKAQFEKLVRNHLNNFIREQFPLAAAGPAAAAQGAAGPPPGRGAEELTADYRAWLAGRVGRVYVLGEAEARPLDRVFVGLSIVEEQGRPSSHAEFLGLMDAEMRRRRDPFAREEEGMPAPGGGKPARTVGPEELLRGRTRAVIAGAPGCGKTTLLKYLALKTLEAGERFPVFLECKAITAEAFRESGQDLARLLFERGVAALPGVEAAERERLRELFDARLKAGEAALFLDGLDEVSGAEFFPRLRESVGEFLRSTHADNTLVISARPYALQARFEGARQMEIAPLSPLQVEEFFRHYYGDEAAAERLLQALRQRRPLRELMRVPFLLGVIARLYREHDRIVESRLDLYRQIVLQLAVKLDLEKSVVRTEFRVPDRGGALKLDFLRQLAFERLLTDEVEAEGERLVFTGEDILEKAKQFWAQNAPPSGSAYDLAEDVKATPLLREVGADAYAFSHLTVQEYLAATALARRPDCDKIFCRAYFNPTLAEMEVLPMTLGLLPRPERLFDALEHLPESLTYTSLRLRARALAYATDPGRNALSVLVGHFERLLNEERREEMSYMYPSLRSFAAAGGRALDALLERTVSTLQGGTTDARLNATWVLGLFGDRRGVSPLLAVLDDAHARERGTALDSLGLIGDEQVIPRLLAVANDKADRARSRAVYALGAFKDGRVVAALFELLPEKDPYVLWAAVGALERAARHDALVTGLISLLRNEDGDARASAAAALTRVVDERAVEPLIEALEDRYGSVSSWAAEALGVQGDERAVGPLIELMNRPSAGMEWGHALNSLGKIGGARAAAALARWMSIGSEDTAARAATALGKMGDPRGVEYLLNALRDPKLARDAAYAFESIKDRRALDPLLDLLNDDNVWMRQGAAVALGNLGDSRAIPHLVEMMTDTDKEDREEIALLLGSLGGEAVVVPLLAALFDEKPGMSVAAAESIGRLADEGLGDGLVTALASENLLVRRRAAEAVGYYLEPGRVKEELARLAEGDPAEGVREAARAALAAVERKAACLG
jgi:HEAT repeat protein